MKKIFTTMLLLISLMMVNNAQAQVKFGLKGGLNVTNMSISSDVIDKSNQTGFFVGPTVKFTVPIIGVGVDVAAVYDQRDAKLNDETLSQKNINIPINLRYNIGLGSLAGIYLAAGPQFGFNIGDKNFNWTSQDSYKNTFTMKKSNLSVNLGAGVMIAGHLEIGATYNIACGKTGDISVSNALSEVISKDNKTNAWQVSAAYYF